MIIMKTMRIITKKENGKLHRQKCDKKKNAQVE